MTAPRRWLQLLWLPCVAACQAPAPTPTPHAALLRADFAALLADLQPPCGAVQEYTRHGRLDYRVVCASGQAYRVRVSADGYVRVTPAQGDVPPAVQP